MNDPAIDLLSRIIADWDEDEIGQLDGALIDEARVLVKNGRQTEECGQCEFCIDGMPCRTPVARK